MILITRGHKRVPSETVVRFGLCFSPARPIVGSVCIDFRWHGFHIVYTHAPDLLGCLEAVAHWDKVYEELTPNHQFAPQVKRVHDRWQRR